MSLPRAESTAPSLVIFDPSDRWGALTGPFLPVGRAVPLEREGRVCRVLRVKEGPLPPADLLLSVVPDRVFDRTEGAALASARPGHRVFVAPVSENQLVHVPRGGYGFEQLAEEVKQVFHAPLLVVVEGAGKRMLSDALPMLFRLTHEVASVRDARVVKGRGLRAARVLLRRVRGDIPDSSALSSILDDAQRAERVYADLAAADARLLAANANVGEVAGEWLQFVDRAKSRVYAEAQGVKYHGVGAENIVAGVAEQIEEVRRCLRTDFAAPPTPSLAAWADDLKVSLASPAVELPIVGLFSSGKTTLLNHVLGTTPQGHPLLRTSQGHNTALLTQFRLKGERESNRVVFHWREHLTLGLLRYDDPAERPVCAPGQGTIESISRDREAGQLVTIRGPRGEVRWVTVPSGRSLLPKVRRGATVSYGEALSDGKDLDAQLGGLLQEYPVGNLTARPWAIDSVAQFIDQKRLSNVRLQVRRRVPNTEPHLRQTHVAVDEELSLSSERGTRLWTLLRSMVQGREHQKELIERIPRHHPSYPLSVTVEADIRRESCKPVTHALESDADWDWFQGPAHARSSEAHGAPCFAESPLAAWLIERAEVFLDEPLLRLVSLVDTPGLNSISEHHDQLTERIIQDGNAFLVMMRLGRDTRAAATERVLTMISASLVAHKVPKAQWRDRVFVVMNWHQREPGAQTPAAARQSADYVHKRLSAMLGSAPPRAYVVNLAPARASESPDELLGYPSLAPLQRDLRALLAVRGLGARLGDARAELDRRYRGQRKDLENQAIALRGGHDAAALKRLDKAIATLGEGAAARQDLYERIDEAVTAVLEPLQSLHDELQRDYRGKEDFAQLRDLGPEFINAYQLARQALASDIPAELYTSVAALGRAWIEVTQQQSRVAPAPLKLPSLTADALATDAANVIEAWPGGLSRLWHALTKLEYHATTERDRLRKKHLSPALLARVTEAADAARAALRESVDAKCDALRAQLQQRRAAADEGTKDRGERLVGIQREQARLQSFQEKIGAMSDTLQRCVSMLEGTVR